MQDFLAELCSSDNLIYYCISIIAMLLAMLLKKVFSVIIGGLINMATKKIIEKNYSQKFSEVKPEYMLNEKANTLEKVGEINIQDQIQSSLQNCLTQVFEKFMVNPEVNQPVAVPKRIDYLEDMSEHLAQVEALKDKYKLNEEMSPEEVYKWLNEQASLVKAIVDKSTTPIKEVEPSEKKDVK